MPCGWSCVRSLQSRSGCSSSALHAQSQLLLVSKTPHGRIKRVTSTVSPTLHATSRPQVNIHHRSIQDRCKYYNTKMGHAGSKVSLGASTDGVLAQMSGSEAAGESALEAFAKPDTWQARYRHDPASCRSLHLLQHQRNNSDALTMCYTPSLCVHQKHHGEIVCFSGSSHPFCWPLRRLQGPSYNYLN